MVVYLPQFLDRIKYFVIFVLENHYSKDVIVRINISGKLKVNHVRARAFLTISKNWNTKKMLSITAIDAATKRALYINGRSVIHLQSTIKQRLTLKVLKIRGICNFCMF